MVASKRAAADPTKSSDENKRACGVEGGTSKSLISDELCCDYQCIWSKLGEEVATNLSKSVVTLVLSDGHKVLFASSGVAIERRCDSTRFVTAASLVSALQNHRDVKIEVHCQGKVVIGVLEEYDLFHKIAFVNAMAFLDVYCVPLHPVVELMPETTVVAVARDKSGKLRAKTGEIGPSDEYGNCEDGPDPIVFPPHPIVFPTTREVSEATIHMLRLHPRPSSWDPDGSNKIVEGLKIKVLLPNNQRKEGKLKHCSLQYNVALVSVKNCRYVRHVTLEQCSVNFSSKVVAVGRSCESGALMATRGQQTCWSGPFDCEDLCYSTCKISKAGIGGPLVDIDGNFVGMNYYDKKMGTPFLYFDVLCGILQYFKTKETKYQSMFGKDCHILKDNDCSQNQWVLPDPSSMDEREREEERKVLASLHRTRGRRIQYAYTDGYVTVLK